MIHPAPGSELLRITLPASSNLFHRDHDFAASVAFFHITDRLGHFAQLIGPIDHWFDFSRLHQVGEDR